jgi:hypothetical protein
MYDLWAVSDHGVSSPRSFLVGSREERFETESNESAETTSAVPLNVVINGRIESNGDLDYARFEASRGQRIVIECWAERIDSRLRPVLEVFDVEGRRLAVSRGYYGIDPLIDFHVPADGSYLVKVQDLISSGGVEHYYRLDIDTGPRVAFSVPTVVERGKASRVTLYGWNLRQSRQPPPSSLAARSPSVAAADAAETTRLASASDGFDQIEVEIPALLAEATWPLPVQFAPAHAVFEGFAYHLAGSHMPVALGVTDVPVVPERADNHSAVHAQLIDYPCEVSGQLTDEAERDWYAIDARRGEALYIEALAQRIHAPADLDISVLDASGDHELTRFSDELQSIRGSTLPTDHLDPAGRFVVPADGRYLVVVRSLGGGLRADPRRGYRLSVRREVPEFQLAVAPHSIAPTGLNVRRGGRQLLDVLAFRRRGFDGPIRITAGELPSGVECPDIWLGPRVSRGTLVVSADWNAANALGRLRLEGFANEARENPGAAGSTSADRRVVRAGTIVRSGRPTGWGRLASQTPLAVAGEAPLRITADGHETLYHHLYGKLQVRHAPGGILDVAIQVERRDMDHQAPVKFLGVGLSELIRNQTAIIPAGQSRGYVSFFLPPTLPTGPYSMAVQAETTVPAADGKTETVTVVSDPVIFEVHPAAFQVDVDPFAPGQAKRGDILQVRYTAQRRNGFIGKMHTELAEPGHVTDVAGLLARGETFVGQTDNGSLRIIVNDDAALGRHPFLRLFTVGVLEDEAVYFGSSFYELEIVE